MTKPSSLPTSRKSAAKTTASTRKSVTSKTAKAPKTKAVSAKATKPKSTKLVTAKTSRPKAPAAVVAVPKVVAAATVPVISEPELRKKELIEAVVARSGIKKKDAKPVIEAMLSVLGEAIATDREMNLPPFAKLRIQRVKRLPTARVTVAKLRQARPAQDAAE